MVNKRKILLLSGLLIGLIAGDSASAQIRIRRQIRSIPTYRSVPVRPVYRPPASYRSVPPYRSPSSNGQLRATRSAAPTQASPSRRVTPTLQASESERPVSTSSATKSDKAEPIVDEIASAALLTDLGTELAATLRRLRHSQSQLGRKHPSQAAIEEQIDDIKAELDRLAGGSELILDDKVLSRLDELGKGELQQLVIRLSQDITELRSRVAELEPTEKESVDR